MGVSWPTGLLNARHSYDSVNLKMLPMRYVRAILLAPNVRDFFASHLLPTSFRLRLFSMLSTCFAGLRYRGELGAPVLAYLVDIR